MDKSLMDKFSIDKFSMDKSSMARIIACLPLDGLISGITYLSEKFPGAKIMLHQLEFDNFPEKPQVLLYIEEDLMMKEHVQLTFIAPKNFDFLFFSKIANPNWKETSDRGSVSDETKEFILWNVQ